MDFHPRRIKSEAVLEYNNYREQSVKNGEFIAPCLKIIVCNFTKPTSNQPSLLSLDEVRTFSMSLDMLYMVC